jgi:hypothetical protein
MMKPIIYAFFCNFVNKTQGINIANLTSTMVSFELRNQIQVFLQQSSKNLWRILLKSGAVLPRMNTDWQDRNDTIVEVRYAVGMLNQAKLKSCAFRRRIDGAEGVNEV